VPAAGSIYFNRQDLSVLDLQAVRRQIGVVLQNGKLTPGDILSNIIGTSTLTLDDAWKAARLSGIDEEIAQMPMGMFTVVGDGQSTLSGGQRQRLMIARAIAPRPHILLFDEATSALDNVTQDWVRQSLAEIKATRLVVAHRLSTIEHADMIYVMEAGRIVQRGSYADLVQQPGLFAELVKRQIA
jgi:ATP-binding cassette subfamily C protein